MFYSFSYIAGIGKHGREYADMIEADTIQEARTIFWRRRADRMPYADFVEILSVELTP